MRPLASPRLRAALWLTAVGVVAALAAGRPEVVAVATPFALLGVAGVAYRRSTPIDAELRLERDRVEEGERVRGELELRSDVATDRLEWRLILPAGLRLEHDDACALVLRAGETRTLPLELRCDHWGVYPFIRFRVRRYGWLRLTADQYELELRANLRVHPSVEALRALARPLKTQASVGDQVARAKGDGIELAELRPFVSGDEPRRVNWRATARTGELVVNELHPERNTAVVLLLDCFTDVGGGRRGPLDRSVQAAAALADRYLARRDRVGLMMLGRNLRWLRPGSGATQLHRIVETVLEARAVPAGSADALPLAVPLRAIPTRAFVLALSPLLSDAVVNTFVELRGRGFDVAVVEIPAIPYLNVESESGDLALRLLRLERDLLRSRLAARGIAVVEWDEHGSLDASLRAMEEFRRRARVVYA